MSAAALTILLGAPVASAAPPAGFQETTAFSGLTEPAAISFAPDGRIFIGEKSGLIKVFSGLGDTTPTTFADLRTDVHNFWDRGLLGMTIDPQFPTRPYVYALYARDAMPGGTPPRWGQAGQAGDPCPSPPGPTGDGCVITGQLTRLTASGDTSSARVDLITDWCQQYPSHSTGDLAFGADGALYVSGGDGASFNFVDYGQDGNPLNPCDDPPTGVGTALTPPTAEGGALRSQDAWTSSDPTKWLDGAILRVDPDTGAGLSGNPFFGSSDANQRKIIALGQRNPFRITIRPGTNEVWSGDVGWNDWEEINRVVDPGGSAENFGWPCYEGSNTGSPRQSGYDGANLNVCENLYAAGSSARVSPYYAYDHDDKVVAGETCSTGSSSISGLDFYQSGPFPDSYNGALFFSDYSRACVWVMLPGSNGLPDKANIQTFNPGAADPVDLEISPQGELFYADLGGGTIRRIRFTAGNQPPNAVATATPSNGNAPLTTTLSASSSTDPNGDTPLTYGWDLNGDGLFGDSNQVTFQHTYTQPGTYNPAVRVSDPSGASDTDSVQVQVNNTPPVAQINAPTASTDWGVGDLVSFSGSATDAQQTLPASAFDWRVVIEHCPSNCHDHVMQSFPDRTSGSFNAPDHDWPSSLRIELTVTDNGGLTDSESVSIDPRTVDLTFNSSPSGLQIGVGPNQSTAPFTRTVIEDSQNSISAPSPQALSGTTYQFQSWSDGGAASHNVLADQDKTLTATFVSPPAPPTINDTDPNSPANDNNPEVKGTTGAGSPTQVKIYTNGTCSGSPAASGTPAQFSGAGITVAVPSDATTQLSARTANAVDSTCSGSFSYTEDSTAPAAPAINDTDPNSPANDSNPEVKGTTGSGSPTLVKIYANGTCSGSPAATGTPAQFSGTGITVAVSGDTTTQLSARTSDAVGNDSSCSAPFSYTEDSTAPPEPSITDSDPDSPANDNSPELKGSAEAGSAVSLYESTSCGGAAEDNGSAAEFASPGLTASVPNDQTLQFTVKAIDAAGNVSPCSDPFSYTEDSTGPEPPVITDTDPDSPSDDNDPEVKGTMGAGSPTLVKLFTNGTCSGTPAATGTPGLFASPGITVSVPSDATTQLSAIASDGLGQDSACSLPLSYTEVSTVAALAPPVLGGGDIRGAKAKKKCKKGKKRPVAGKKVAVAAKKCKKVATAKR